jgi:DNA-binding response OmpR family regulator
MRLNAPGQFRTVGSAIGGRRRQMDPRMNAHKVQRLAKLTNQLAETLMTAAICAEEIRTEIHAELDVTDTNTGCGWGETTLPNSSGVSRRPILDQSTLCVQWNAKSLHLGHTRAFWLLARLSRRPNQYVTHLDLLHDVWDDESLSAATIRSVVRHLRRRLCDGGMSELAAAIHGHNGRYILSL